MDPNSFAVSPSWATDAVPRLIHQTAPSDPSKWHALWPLCQRTWREKFPDYEYKLWSDEDIDQFMKTRFPEFYPSFVGFRYQIQRVDAFRYFLLYDIGGIYVDMDYQCVQPFGHLLPNGRVSIAENTHWPERFQNALMASPPKHPFWRHVFAALLKSYTQQMHPSKFHSVLYTAGPGMLEMAWQGCPPEFLNALPKEQFSFYEKEDSALLMKRKTLEAIVDPNVFAAHHCTVMWVPGAYSDEG